MTETLADLEARIADDPDDAEAWLVLADLLQKRGDPHGDLIALQIAADRQPPGKKKTPEQAAFAKAFAKHAPTLIQPLVKHGASTKNPLAPPFVWRTGFVRRATIHEPPIQQPATTSPSQVLVALLALPAARFLTELSVRTIRRNEVHAILDAITARPPRALQELELLAFTHTGPLATIWKSLPRLRRIAITAHRCDLDGLELPEARRASFVTLGMTAASLQAIASAPWPHLERLEIRIGYDASHDDGNFAEVMRAEGFELPKVIDSTFEDIAPLLRRRDMPALTHLRIRKASYAGGVLRALCESPLAVQLEVLDLSGGTLTPQDIKYASVRRAAFAKLRELWLPPLDQWPGVTKDLEGMAKHVITKAPLDTFER